MDEIINELVDNVVTNKPNRLKQILKWVIRGSIVVIAAAFVFGQVKMANLNRLNDIEKATTEIKSDMTEGFSNVNDRIDNVNNRIDKIYVDGYTIFGKYQEYNKKQLELIIDYGNENKDLLKKMIDFSNYENLLNIESNIEISKNVSTQPSKEYISMVSIVSLNGKDSLINISGATVNYISSINTNRYNILKIIKNVKNPNLFDVQYKNIK